MNSRNLLLVAALVLAGIVGVYWAVTQKPIPPQKSEPQKVVEKPLAAQHPAPQPARPAPGPVPKPESQPAAEAAQAPLYETQIDQVLRSNVSETESAKILINMLPTMPEEGQVEAAQHIANLLPDSDYQSILPTLLNPNTPESVSSVLFTDLMNRSDATKLNTFLEIAKTSGHPNQEEAQSDLQIFLDQDYGTDWAKYKAAIAEYLAKQAAGQ